MIGMRVTPHHVHGTAVLVRVVAATVTLATLVLVPVTVAGAALHHLAPGAAAARIAVAVALTAVVLFAARRVDPLRG